MYTLAITVVPSILILLFFYLSDKFKEPKSTITTVFFLGILICLPAGILNGFMSDNFGDPENQNDLTYSFLVACMDRGNLKIFSFIYDSFKKKRV